MCSPVSKFNLKKPKQKNNNNIVLYLRFGSSAIGF